jgi:hypothetical protein
VDENNDPEIDRKKYGVVGMNINGLFNLRVGFKYDNQNRLQQNPQMLVGLMGEERVGNVVPARRQLSGACNFSENQEK